MVALGSVLSQLALLWEELQLACRAPLGGSGKGAAAVGIRNSDWITDEGEGPAQYPVQSARPRQMQRAIVLV